MTTMMIKKDYFENGLAFFTAHPDVVGLTGTFLLNGVISGNQISFQAADETIAASKAHPAPGFGNVENLTAVTSLFVGPRPKNLGFDERVPLCSWLEDLDFARASHP
jgi:hypothetical protein